MRITVKENVVVAGYEVTWYDIDLTIDEVKAKIAEDNGVDVDDVTSSDIADWATDNLVYTDFDFTRGDTVERDLWELEVTP